MEQAQIDEHAQKCDANFKKVLRTGPWTGEPHRLNWKHAGLDCMIVRHFSRLHLCGYVGVKKGHPLYGAEYNAHSDALKVLFEKRKEGEVNLDKTSVIALFCYAAGGKDEVTPELVFEVHGGLTFSNQCGGYICHLSSDGDKTWWFGFDCAHGGDYGPPLYDCDLPLSRHAEYRDIDYVREETNRLAEQLASIGGIAK